VPELEFIFWMQEQSLAAEEQRGENYEKHKVQSSPRISFLPFYSGDNTFFRLGIGILNFVTLFLTRSADQTPTAGL
jgi:hypothetical protein